jgi:hypothetical protein
MRDKPILSSERILHKDYDRNVSVTNKNSGRGPQAVGAKKHWQEVNRQS